MPSEIKVLSSIATREAYLELVPQFEKSSGHEVATTWSGTTAIMQTMAGAKEQYDLVVISSTELEELIRQGKIIPGSRVDLAKSGIGIAVRAGAPRPDVRTSAALKQALLAAKTVGYTSGPSGVYMAGLIERMGIAAEVKPKHRGVPSGGTIGTIVANGGAEIGFQQVSELLPVSGIDYLGPLPAEIQHFTIFAAGRQCQHEGTRCCEGIDRFHQGACGPSHHQEIGHGARLTSAPIRAYQAGWPRSRSIPPGARSKEPSGAPAHTNSARSPDRLRGDEGRRAPRRTRSRPHS
jgi:molybdate transport system substrate-binding protein